MSAPTFGSKKWISCMSLVSPPSVRIVLLGGACKRPSHLSQSCLPYEPEVVVLTGTLTEERRFGAPDYGENPSTDRKLIIPILQLGDDVNVCGQAKSELNADTIRGVRQIQLIFAGERPTYQRLLHEEVRVTGTLEEAVLGSDFTDVVMTVKAIKPVGRTRP